MQTFRRPVRGWSPPKAETEYLLWLYELGVKFTSATRGI